MHYAAIENKVVIYDNIDRYAAIDNFFIYDMQRGEGRGAGECVREIWYTIIIIIVDFAVRAPKSIRFPGS